MEDILGDYRGYISRAGDLLSANGISDDEVTQCDTIAYECTTNERYEQVKQALGQLATIVSEYEVNGRLVSIIQCDPALAAGKWQVPYIELLQPKTTRENNDGIDCVFFVTSVAVRKFMGRHADVPFVDKGLANGVHPYIELKGDDVAVKFHGMHFGTVIDVEKALE